MKWLVSALLVLGAIVLAGISLFGFTAVREELSRPAERTQVVLRLEATPAELESACAVLRRRLEHSPASEFSVGTRGTNEVVVEYRASADHDKALEVASLIQSRGQLRFLVRAEAQDFVDLGSTLELEQAKLDAWRQKHSTAPTDEFATLAPEAGGPVRGLSWCPTRSDSDKPSYARTLVPLVDPKPEWRFGSSDLGSVGFASSSRGSPAVSFELRADRQAAFGDFTASIIDRGMAIVIDGEIVVLATVNGRLMGASMIEGGRSGFTQSEVTNLIRILRAGELPSKPVLVSTKQVTASRSLRWIVAGLAAVGAGVTAIALIVLAILRLRARPAVESD